MASKKRLLGETELKFAGSVSEERNKSFKLDILWSKENFGNRSQFTYETRSLFEIPFTCWFVWWTVLFLMIYSPDSCLLLKVPETSLMFQSALSLFTTHGQWFMFHFLNKSTFIAVKEKGKMKKACGALASTQNFSSVKPYNWRQRQKAEWKWVGEKRFFFFLQRPSSLHPWFPSVRFTEQWTHQKYDGTSCAIFTNREELCLHATEETGLWARKNDVLLMMFKKWLKWMNCRSEMTKNENPV